MPRNAAVKGGRKHERSRPTRLCVCNNRRMHSTDIGERVTRTEDPQLLRGQGRYPDDLNESGQAYAAIVRSPYAHGVLKGIASDAAMAMPGVLAIYTADD